ncbi:MAG: tRNA1(Val) (adenine(37)-N6)-methyltransferase [Bacteroidota bacterium]
MANPYFQFKQFRIEQDRSAMKVTTDSCIFGGWVASQLQANHQPIHLLDIGTGTGLLSLMIAQALPLAQITAVEIDEQAAGQARVNIAQSPWKKRIQVLQADIKSLITDNKYEVVVSNPPFYEQDLISPDPVKNQAHHDASLSFGELIIQLDRLLTQQGSFFLLLPAKGLAQRVEALQKMGLYPYHLVHLQHSNDHPVMRILLAGSRNVTSNVRREFICIQEQDGGYSQSIRELLSAYYLAF